MLSGTTNTITHARRLRRTLSIPEVILWTRLRQRPGGFKFRRQHPAGRYILDFYCHEAQLAIEVDGLGHEMGDQPTRDATRDNWLRQQNIRVVRIAASEVSRDPDAVVETIILMCHGEV